MKKYTAQSSHIPINYLTNTLLLVFSIFAFIFIVGCLPDNAETDLQSSQAQTKVDEKPKKPKNIILMVGDGMGLTQISAAMYMNRNKLHFERMPVVGLSKTYAADNLVTDSAAGATAFACGQKTYNGAIGVDLKKLPIGTILEEAKANGLSTGLVASSTIVHATPASFAAHQVSRHFYEEIACDMAYADVDIMIGGGQKYFESRSDEMNLLDSLKAQNYQIIDSTQSIDALDETLDLQSHKIACFTAHTDPDRFSEGRDYLQPAANKAVNFLNQNNKGFFLMIEGSQIDWGGHANEVDYVIKELLEFNKIIGDVLDFAEQDGNTLVIVTADHETGGLAINPKSQMNKNIEAAFTTTHHTAVMVPVFAYGPGADKFAGIYENTAIYHKMKASYNF